MMTNKTIYLAVILSTGLHLGVLLPLLSDPDTLVIHTPTRPTSHLALVVSAPAAPAQAKAQQHSNTKQAETKAVSTPAPAKPHVAKHTGASETRASQETEHKPATPATQLANSSDPLALLDHDMLEYLHAEFRARFQYPLLARKRGWSGEVVIALNVNHNGMIHDVAVQKSSGYPLLDNNALDTFRAIGLIGPAIQSRLYKTHHLSIPVIYKLTGG